MELRNCPFCAGKPLLKHIGNEYTKKKVTEISCSTIGCFATQRCGSLGNRNSFEWCDEHAAKTWNTRVEDAEIARLREALEKIASCQSHTEGDVVSIARKALEAGHGEGK